MLRSLRDADGRHTPREILALIEWLPTDSAYSAALAGGRHHRGWDVNVWQNKAVIDLLQSLIVLTYKANAGKKAKNINPETYPTPDELLARAEKANKQPKKPAVSLAEFADRIGNSV